MEYGSSFLEKKKEPKKTGFLSFSDWITVIRFLGTGSLYKRGGLRY